MRKSIAAMSLTATLLGGSALGVTVFAPHLVGAAQTDTSTSGSTPTTAGGSTTPSTEKPSRTDKLDQVLQPLVDNGTITAAQRDAVVAALEAAGPGAGHGGPMGHIGFGKFDLDTVASALGIDAATLRSDLQSGKTIAQIASDQGVDVQKVIDAVVSDVTTKIGQAVKDGKLTQAQADTITSNLNQRITDAVNGQLPFGPGRGFGHRHGG
jgi:hypothetical protein